MRLYFLRHGLAADREEWTEDDGLRPLTKKGKEKMARQSKTIARLGLALDVIVTSPLKRSRQTARILAERLEMEEELVEDERLSPGFDLLKLGEILKDYPEAESLLFVGHEPDFSETVSALAGGGRLVFKKGGLARVDLSSREPLEGELVWLLPPKMLI